MKIVKIMSAPRLSGILLSGVLLSGTAFAHGDYDRGQRVEIASPQNYAVVSSPVPVNFKAYGVKIAPAGVDKHNAGHFHLAMDQVIDPTIDEPMQPSAQHLLFTAGEMDTVLALTPGRHILQLVVADEEHAPFENLVSPIITIEVKP